MTDAVPKLGVSHLKLRLIHHEEGYLDVSELACIQHLEQECLSDAVVNPTPDMTVARTPFDCMRYSVNAKRQRGGNQPQHGFLVETAVSCPA